MINLKSEAGDDDFFDDSNTTPPVFTTTPSRTLVERQARKKKWAAIVVGFLLVLGIVIVAALNTGRRDDPPPTTTTVSAASYVTRTATPLSSSSSSSSSPTSSPTSLSSSSYQPTSSPSSSSSPTSASSPAPTPAPTRANLTDYRLPSWLKPSSYALDIEPNLDTNTIVGVVRIDLLVNATTDEIVMHCEKINVTSATIFVDDVTSFDVLDVQYVRDDHDFLVLRSPSLFEATLAGVRRVVLSVMYEAELGDDLAGFYRSSFINETGGVEPLAVTQFESTSARKAFPCFDEPALKAVFNVSLRVNTKRFPTVLSNGVELRRTPTTSFAGAAQLDKVEFASSPRMSTYLLAFFVGRFDYHEADAVCGVRDGATTPAPRTRIRVYSTPQASAERQTVYAAVVARCSLSFYEEYFGIEFPLPTMNLLAIPDFEAGAMENWGLVTFRLSALLYDVEHSTASDKASVANVIAHELAHQWFGDLVTMAWWNDLWLNEGFATFMSYKAVDAMYRNDSHPDGAHDVNWRLRDNFAQMRLGALNVDSLSNSHPISQPSDSPAEINLLFDGISYSKGASILAMIESSLSGDNSLAQALHNYLSAHAYDNAKSDDLWRAIGAQQNHSIPEYISLMDSWLLQKGYPVLKVSRDASSSNYRLSQRLYVADMSNKSIALNSTERWWLPIKIRDANATRILTLTPDSDATTTSFSTNAPVVINQGRAGFYRVHYSDDLLERIVSSVTRDGVVVDLGDAGAAMTSAAAVVGAIDFVGIVDDLMAFAASGFDDTMATALNLSVSFLNQTASSVPTSSSTARAFCSVCFQQAIGVLNGVAGALEAGDAEAVKLAKRVKEEFVKPLLQPLVADFLNNLDDYLRIDDGTSTAQVDHSRIVLLESMLPLAVRLENTDVIRLVEQVWQNATISSSSIVVPPIVQLATFTNAARNVSSFARLFDMFQKTSHPGERNRLLNALTHTSDANLQLQLMSMAVNGTIHLQDRNAVFFGIASTSSEARERVFSFLIDSFAKLANKGAIFGSVSGLYAGVASGFATESDRAIFAQFCDDKQLKGRDIKQALERIDVNINWLKRNTQSIANFLG